MKLSKILFYSLMVIFIAISSCGKDGPEGPEGPLGPAGPAGPTGPKGDEGNANVKSKIFLPANITWRQTTLFGTNYVTASLNIPEINTDIINNGAVMVYGGFFWGDPWSALPLSYFESGRTVHFSYGMRAESVTLRMHYSTNVAPTAPNIQFKVVIIKGEALANARVNEIQLDNLAQVENFFGLKL